MAETVGQHSVAAFTSPVNGTSPIDANTVKGNDNTIRSAYVDHDADPGIHVQSSTLASRPTANSAGRKWMTADSGVIRLFYDDGTNWYEADYLRTTGGTISGNLAVTGTLGVTGVTTLTAQPILSSLTASQAVFTDASKGLVSNAITGTGNVVMSASPTLTGTIQAAAATLSGALGVSGLLTFASLKGTGATTVTNILDEDNMASDSATALATQQSIKAYVDAQVGASDALSEVLAIGNTTGANDIIVSTGQKIRTPAVAAGDGSPAITIANTSGALTFAAALADSNLATISTAGKVANSATTATDANTASAIVARDASGNFSAGTITAALTGNASTATALQTARTINGTSFDGTANITVTAAAGTLTGTTLASNVVSSSLTSVGTLANLTVTNPISGSVTGSSGSTTGNAATATALQTARNINGVSFNGTADITVTAAAGTLTGTTLASGVTASSLTSVGTLTSLTVSGNTSLASSSGGVGIGAAAGSSKLNVAGTFTKNTGDENTWGIRVTDETAMTTGVGGGLVFVGNYTSGGGKASFASIAGAKANSTTGNGLGELRFYTTDASSILQQRAVIDGAGNLAVDTNTLYVDAANNRVGIGTASPASTLDVRAANASQSIRVTATTGTNPAYFGANNTGGAFYFGLDNSTGTEFGSAYTGAIYLSGAYPITFYTNAVERMRLDASGNLGLGVTPSAWISTWRALQTLGGALAGASDRQLVMQNCFVDSGGNTKYVADGFASFYRQTSGQHQFFTAASGLAGNNLTANTQAMTLDASGNLGVGTTSPQAYTNYTVLTVDNATNGGVVSVRRAGTPLLNLYTAAGEGRVEAASSAFLSFYTTSAERARITSGGDFCVNATSGNGRLSVRGPGTTTGYSFEAANSAGTTRFIVQDGGLIQFLSNTSGTESGRFTTGGYFKASNNGTYNSGGVGTDHEFQQSAAGRALLVSNSNSNPTGILIYYGNVSPNGTGNRFWYCEDSTAVRAELRSNGGLANYTANDVNLSDERVKTDILPAPSYWDTLKAIEIVTFKYKDQTHDDVNVGVIAQQIEQVNPVWVDTDGFGETPEDGVPLKAVYSEDIKFAAIKALQEAMARIEALEARLEALEA